MVAKTVFFNNKNWKYFVEYKEQKNMYLKLKGNKIIVSAPFFVRYDIIENFVCNNLVKIIVKIKEFENYQNLINEKILFCDEPFIFILDKKLLISIKYQSKTKFFISEDTFFIYSPLSLNNESDHSLILKKINVFLKNLAKPIFLERLNYWQKIMNLETQTFEVRLMKNKWGVCFHNLKKITLNSKLIHFSYEVIDYVIIHELSHLVHCSHNKDFWNLVSLYCYNYKECRDILKYSSVGLKNEGN